MSLYNDYYELYAKENGHMSEDQMKLDRWECPINPMYRYFVWFSIKLTKFSQDTRVPLSDCYDRLKDFDEWIKK